MAGLDGSKEVLLPLSASAQTTLANLARHAGAHSVLKVSPFCHVGENNDVRGWVLDMSGDAPASALPLNCTFFDGLSVVECDCTEAEALQLLTRPEETRQALGQAIHRLMSQVTEDQRATWRRCRPTENGVPPSLYSAVLGRDNQVTLCTMPDAVPLIDSEPWVPELSPEGFVGLFHHWHPVRKRLCIYMACQSYLPKACLEFADLVRDLGDSCTSWDILHSEEAQWLRHANTRNRARILALICHEMGLQCPCMLDYCNAERGRVMAVVTCETLHHDMLMLMPTASRRGAPPARKGRRGTMTMMKATYGEQQQQMSAELPPQRVIRVLNHCASGNQATIVCHMAPWEGLWLFQGEGQAHDAFTRLFMPTCTAEQQLSKTKGALMQSAQGPLASSAWPDEDEDEDEEPAGPKKRKPTQLKLGGFTLAQQQQRLRLLKCTFTSPQKVTADRLEVLHLWEHQRREASDSLYCLLQEEDGEQLLGEDAQRNQHRATTSNAMLTLMMNDAALQEDEQLLLMMSGGATTATLDELKMKPAEHAEEEETEEEILLAYKRSIAQRLSAVPKRRRKVCALLSAAFIIVGAYAFIFFWFQGQQLQESIQHQSNSIEYLVFDEHILQTMVEKGWNRTLGYTVLMPLGYGMCKEWWKHRLIQREMMEQTDIDEEAAAVGVASADV
jgi:hypothetical protein